MLNYFVRRCKTSRIHKTFIEFRFEQSNFEDLKRILHKVFGYQCVVDFTLPRFTGRFDDLITLTFPLSEFLAMISKYQYGYYPLVVKDSSGAYHVKGHYYASK